MEHELQHLTSDLSIISPNLTKPSLTMLTLHLLPTTYNLPPTTYSLPLWNCLIMLMSYMAACVPSATRLPTKNRGGTFPEMIGLQLDLCPFFPCNTGRPDVNSPRCWGCTCLSLSLTWEKGHNLWLPTWCNCAGNWMA